jgi:abortive infection bacteriophage resistance protein
MRYPKVALTFEAQLTRMKERGLHVEDEQLALETLQRISYYRLTGYLFRFRIADTDNFEPGTSFEEAVRLYEFDRRLRLLLLDAVERLEVALRTAITYEFGHRYGAFGHTEAANFATERYAGSYLEWLKTARDEAQRAQELFIKSYRSKYDGFPDLPIWMASEVMSFGTLSKMLASMKNPDQRSVAEHFQVHQSVFTNWIHVVSVIRNRCAHHSRLWNWQLGVSARRITHSPLWNRQVLQHTNRTFYVLLIVRKLLRAAGDRHVDSWRNQVTDLLKPFLDSRFYQHEMGAHTEWETDPLWA